MAVPELYFGVVDKIFISDIEVCKASFGKFVRIRFANLEKMNLKVGSQISNAEANKSPKIIDQALVRLKITNPNLFSSANTCLSVYGQKYNYKIMHLISY